MPAQVIPSVQSPTASSPAAAATATAARRPIRKWVLLGIAALLAVALVVVGGVVMVNQPWRKVGFNATVHAAGPDMPKLCQSLLGSDKDVSKAFGISVTATDPGDKADTGVCMYRDDSGTDHGVGVDYAPQPHADGDAEVPDDAASADVERVSATSQDGRYAISLKDDSSIDEETASRLRSLFQKAANRLTDDTEEWSSSLPKLDSGTTLIPSQSVCDGRACNGEETQSSAQTSAQSSGGADQSKKQSNQAKGDDSSKSDKTDKSDKSNQSSGKSDAKTDRKSGASDESDKDAAGVTTGVGDIASNVPTAYAYDTSLALLDHPKAVKAKLEDGSTQYVMPADGESFTLLDFRRSPGNACAKDVCTWKGDASKEATLKVGGKANDGAGRVLKGVVGSNVAAHGTFVVSGAADAELKLDVKAGKKTYSATMKADAAAAAAGAGADGSADAGSDGADGDGQNTAKPAVDAEKAKKAAVEGVGAHDDACAFGCTATGVVPFEHPVWGTTYLVTVAMGAKAKAPSISDVDGYDYAYGFAVVGQSGQAMYGSSVFLIPPEEHGTVAYLQTRFNILPALDKPDKAGNILLAEYVYGGGSGVSDTLQAFHVGADGTLKALDVRKGEPTSYVDQTITDKGDVDGDGLADLTMRMGDVAGGVARFNAWRGTYRWAWNAKDSAYEFTALEPGKEDAIANAELFATNLYKGAAEDMATHLSGEAEIFSWGECAVKQVADIQPFDVKEGGPGGMQTRHIDDPVGYSLDMSSFFAWFGGRGNGQPVDNLLTDGGDGSVEYCKLLHTSGGGGMGGISNTTNSLDFGDATYDAKSRTAKLQATITWTTKAYDKGTQETVTNPTITVVFDKKGQVKRVDTTAWGMPRNQ